MQVKDKILKDFQLRNQRKKIGIKQKIRNLGDYRYTKLSLKQKEPRNRREDGKKLRTLRRIETQQAQMNYQKHTKSRL